MRPSRFYEQFGSRFEWDIPGVAGRSLEQPTSDFRTLDSIPGVRVLTFDVALAKAYSHIEFLEQDLKGKRMQFANVNKQMDSETARNRMYRRVCTIVVAVTVVAELFLRLK